MIFGVLVLVSGEIGLLKGFLLRAVLDTSVGIAGPNFDILHLVIPRNSVYTGHKYVSMAHQVYSISFLLDFGGVNSLTAIGSKVFDDTIKNKTLT